MKTKIFLSCGQSPDERGLAEKIATRIGELGFECYIAITDQNLIGLRENIFKQLETSEYFVFVDFVRDEFKPKDSDPKTGVHRGSLFSNQELAIASYLEMPCLVLQEAGVKARDGMLSCLQANAVLFSDRGMLPGFIADLVQQKVAKGEWSVNWTNCLSINACKVIA